MQKGSVFEEKAANITANPYEVGMLLVRRERSCKQKKQAIYSP